MEPDIAGVLSQFKSIKKHASLLRQSISSLYGGPIKEIECLVEEFKDAKTHFERIRHKQKIGTYLRGIEMTVIYIVRKSMNKKRY